jgi:PAS domain S-box-containing protein
MSNNTKTYAELENQLAELKRQNESINLNSVIQSEEKEERAAELIVANEELMFQNDEKEKRAAELIIANKELVFQNQEKEKRAAEFVIANEELVFQNEEKEKRAAELIVANEELMFQNDEKEKRAAELIIANKELLFQNDEKEKRAAELIVANKELVFQNAEKEKRAAELVIANTELVFQNAEKEKRAAELIIAKEHQKSAERLEKIASRVPGMVYQFRLDRNGNSCYPYTSLAIQEIFQVTPDEVRESAAKAFAVIHPEDYTPFINSINLSAQNLTPWKHEYRTRFNNGEVRWLLGNALPQREKDGSTLWYGFITDITEHKLTEEAMQAAKLEAVRANQAKSEFLANMSHEIRTPMNAILGFSEILADLITDSTQRYYLHAIKTSGKTLLQLINDILDLSKIEASKFALQYAPVSVSALLEDMDIVFSQKSADKSIDFSLLIDENLPTSLLLDEIRLRQVLLNLIGNAIKFTDHGFVKVAVFVNFTELPNTVNLKFEISDSGMGIPKEQQEKIFAAFTQQDNQSVEYGGTGLGLTICRRLLELMHGNIEVESQVGVGSCFTLILNNVAIVANAPIMPVSEEYPELFRFQAAQILLVDDIKLNRQLISTYLAEFTELTLVEAQTGQQALDLAGLQHFDLILMDRRLPDIDGDKVCEQIRAFPNCVDIPIIMITASVLTAQEKQKVLFYNLQLNKPVNKSDLLTALQSFLPLDESFCITDEFEANSKTKSVISENTISPEKLRQLAALLNSAYLAQITEQLNNSDIVEIHALIDIAEQLLVLAKQYQCKRLADWATALKTQAKRFDLDALSKTLKGFEELLKQLLG